MRNYGIQNNPIWTKAWRERCEYTRAEDPFGHVDTGPIPNPEACSKCKADLAWVLARTNELEEE